ncbi:thiamine pyrophosphate-binding protein [Streptomyces sp. NRRL S-244]|uniref:thiamine pyrophosphate-binding protein n=1 Tax=Streptomyces sp. NRRL S-244 TaxID=1463897 RepID=UPI0004C18C55|nr:thiamine pyrophosphate-binding protein [Streptomyces sp. NRRL S-244]
MKRTGADVLVDALRAAGAESFFGLPGESTLPLYDAFRRAGVRHVMARSETAAGYMADACARYTGRAAVADAPGGIGSPLLLPALHEAYNSSIPLVALTSGVPLGQEDRWPTAACRHQEMFRPCVKATVAVPDAARLPELAARAVRLAMRGRPGPVHLDVPSDVLADPAAAEPVVTDGPAAPPTTSRTRPGPAALAQVVDLLTRARRPLLVAGGGVHLSGAYDQLAALTDAFRVPVATTFNGKGVISETHPHSLGVIGAKGSAGANAVAERADLVLWVASKAGDKSTGYGRLPGPDAVCVQLDIDEAELGRILSPRYVLHADAATALEDLAGALRASGWQGAPAWTGSTGALIDEPEGDAAPTPGRLIQAVERTCPPDTALIADASRACSWAGAHFRCRSAGRSVIAPRGSGSIGYALPAAIAAALVHPGRTVVGVGGDGGFALSCQEMETAVRIGARLVFVLLNDNAFGLLNRVASVGLGQADLLGSFAPTDWTAVARGFGWQAHTVRDEASFERALKTGIEADRPTLLNVLLSSDAASPDFRMYAERHAVRR